MAKKNRRINVAKLEARELRSKLAVAGANLTSAARSAEIRNPSRE